MENGRGLAIITGASSGIGYELAKRCADDGYNLVIAADEAKIETVAQELRSLGCGVHALQCDLAKTYEVDRLVKLVGDRTVDILIANAGHGLGEAFLDQNFEEARHVVDTNIAGTIYLVQVVGKRMRAQRSGKILITGSEAGFIPGAYQAVYNGTKAFVDSFSFALREELRDSGVTVTCLMPGATETAFFARARLLDTKVGQSSKDDPAMVARKGFEAMMAGHGDVVTGWRNKVKTSVANITPAGRLARMHRGLAEPGYSERSRDEGAGWIAPLAIGAGALLGILILSNSAVDAEDLRRH
ncbi:MAG: SDR family NAD(P)-dependent oxidoreductase [Beijerinckiaceae bacterium]|nr:SDR family NAD(P)-dependent oxidoreductase [Beijerinckiaceae bacterium]